MRRYLIYARNTIEVNKSRYQIHHKKENSPSGQRPAAVEVAEEKRIARDKISFLDIV